MDVSQNDGTPIAGCFMMENPKKNMDDLGGSPILGNLHLAHV